MGFVDFTHRAARAKSIGELASSVMDHAGALVGARGVGFYLFAKSDVTALVTRGVPEKMLDTYERIGRTYDPVLAKVRRVHAPMAMPLASIIAYSRVRRFPDAYMSLLDYAVGHHYLLAPVIVDGELAGTLHFARAEDCAFGHRELAAASALALHVSTRVTALNMASRVDPSCEQLLTARGREVAELAVRGLTTCEMGRVLGVSSNTVKKHLRDVYARLAIGTRAELASILARPPGRASELRFAPAHEVRRSGQRVRR